MGKEIIVNCLGRETRVAVMEKGQLVELYLERPLEKRVVGNIYKGVVENVLPGMQAAFVNVGLERNTFLYVTDATPGVNEQAEKTRKRKGRVTIRDLVHSGKEILVQVTKEPFGNKGARVTRQITLPGRYVVLMPTVNHVGVSRRIVDPAERERLRQIAMQVKPKQMGVIVRTVATDCTAEEIKQDIDFLAKLWDSICYRSRWAKAPALIHRDLDLVGRVIRDLLDENVDRLIVDSLEQYQAVLELLEATAPEFRERVFFFQEQRPIFETFGLEVELEKALADTVLRTNLEAAEEIAHQIRLRNIGGIIIIDFIDMAKPEHQQQVLKKLEEAVKADKTKSTVLGLTQLGLVEMTRQKVRQNLGEVLQKPCPCCEGTGYVLHEEVIGNRIEMELKHYFRTHQEEAVLLDVNPVVAAVLIGSGGSNLERLEAETGRHIFIRGNSERSLEDWAIVLAGNSDMVEKVALPVEVGDILSLRLEDVHLLNTSDAIARKDGFVIQVDQAAPFVGQKVLVEITRTFRTYAKGRLSEDFIDAIS